MKKILLVLLVLLSIASCSYFKSNNNLISLIPYRQKDLYGYFDLNGKIIINPQFAYASTFNDGLALIKTTGNEGKYGYIEENGKFKINAAYKEATIFNEGIAFVVKENGAPTAINKDGESLFVLNDVESVQTFSEGLAAFSVSDSISAKWGFVDKEGKKTINAQFYEVGKFSNGKCAVKDKNGKWGYIDKNGKITINYQFENATEFINDKAVVYLNNKAGIIDEDGKYIINPQFEQMDIDNNKYLIRQDNKYGWCDSEGKIIINAQFESATIFGENKTTPVKSGDSYGYIDEEGKFVINPQFDLALSFNNSKAIVKSGETFGLIDEEGKYVVNPQFEEVSYDTMLTINTKGRIKSLSYCSVTSDYINTNNLTSILNFKNPENLNLNLGFSAIANKFGKTSSDFDYYNTIFYLISNKKIDANFSYSFGVSGQNLVEYDYNSYSNIITNNKPDYFTYSISLNNKAYDKSESICKIIESKLSNYKLTKKGFINNNYAAVYSSNDNKVVLEVANYRQINIYIVKNNYDLSSFINKIKNNKEESYTKNENNTNGGDIAVDTVSVSSPEEEYYD